MATPAHHVSKSKATLSTYRQKRDFTKTTEPAGKSAVPAAGELRFVIQWRFRRNHPERSVPRRNCAALGPRVTSLMDCLRTPHQRRRLARAAEYYSSRRVNLFNFASRSGV